MSVTIVAEIGINHNGDLETALKLIDAAKFAGADAVKFQKRSPRDCVPEAYWKEEKTFNGETLPYIEYREKMEFGSHQFNQINEYCDELEMPWFLSVWDLPSLEFESRYELPAIKIGSPMFTDEVLVSKAADTGRPLILSTGMTSMKEINDMMTWLSTRIVTDTQANLDVTLCQCTSVYPCPPELINLRVIETFKKKFPWANIGYSGHEVEIGPTIGAIALGAEYIERHITLDRMQEGSDHRASLDAEGFRYMVQQIRRLELAMGDGNKIIHKDELPAAAKLRHRPIMVKAEERDQLQRTLD